VERHRLSKSDCWPAAALVQAAYYVPSGLWPIFSIRSFEAITGPKADRWLVKTVGALLALIGGVVGFAGIRQVRSPEIEALGAGSAALLAGVDLIYALRGRISRVYLLDALIEAGIITRWAFERRNGVPA
jgi:hypothetical protein